MISKNKINILLSTISLYLATNITLLGPVIALPTTLIVLCSSRFNSVSAKAYKCYFIGAITIIVLLANTSNQISYPIIDDIVKIDLSQIRTTEPSPGDNFVLLTKAREYLMKDRFKDGKIVHDWVDFRVSKVKISHPDLSTSIYIVLVPINPDLNPNVEYIMFERHFNELKRSGILSSNKSSLTGWWILTF